MSNQNNANLLKVTIDYNNGDQVVYESVAGFSPFGPNMIRLDQLVEPEKATSIVQLTKEAKHLFLPISDIKRIESVDQPLEVKKESSIVTPR